MYLPALNFTAVPASPKTGRREAVAHVGRPVLPQPGLRSVDVVDAIGRPAHLREEPGADGRRPLHLPGVAGGVPPEPAAHARRLDVLSGGMVVARDLVVAVEPHRELVPRRALDGEPQVVAVDLPVVYARRSVAVEAVEHDPIADPPVPAVEEPHAVADGGSAERSVQFVRPVDAVHRRDALVPEPRGQVGPGEVPVHGLVVEGSGELVSAFARDQTDAHSAGRGLGVGTARLDRHLVREGVVQVVLRRAVAAQVVELHAVDEDGSVVVFQPRGPNGVLIHGVRAADVQARPDARHQRDPRLPAPARGHGVDDLAGNDLRALRLLYVDDRGFARYRDGLLEGADEHLHVDRHREVRRQREPVANDGGEARKRERHLVGAGRRSTIPYRPCPSVTAMRRPSMRAGLLASTVTPGSTPPVLSVTWPTIRLWPCTAAGGSAASRTASARSTTRLLSKLASFSFALGGHSAAWWT